MSFPASIFLVALYFVGAICGSHNYFLAPQRAQRSAENAKSARPNSFAPFAPHSRTLSPNYHYAPPISRISYASAGGKAGNYESLQITPDSLIYVQGHRGVEKMINQRTVPSFWEKLSKSINLTHFDKIRSDPGHSLYDGIDVTITIEQGKQRHSIVNGNEDSVNYVKIKPFTDLLESKLVEIRTKIVLRQGVGYQ
jgi:hypothetical protein